jgi:hypothetical protein
MKAELKQWLDKYPVLDEADHPALEASAAIKELRQGLPKEEAESAAHNDYLKQHAVKAMAHHLLGSKAALAVGNEEAAMQHGKAYAEASKHSGYGLDEVPDEVKDIIKSGKYSKIYNHKPHEADVFFMPKDEEGKVDKKPKEPHSDNVKIKQVLEGLDKLKTLLN